jgi:hypothetical protein
MVSANGVLASVCELFRLWMFMFACVLVHSPTQYIVPEAQCTASWQLEEGKQVMCRCQYTMPGWRSGETCTAAAVGLLSDCRPTQVDKQ